MTTPDRSHSLECLVSKSISEGYIISRGLMTPAVNNFCLLRKIRGFLQLLDQRPIGNRYASGGEETLSPVKWKHGGVECEKHT